jgi:hypothetical protein
MLSGCSRTELAPAPELVPAAPQLFENGPGAVVTEGSPGADQTSDGPLWWFTAPDGVLGVYNGSGEPATVRVSADVVVPACQTTARVQISLPGGHSRTVEATPAQSGRMRFAVRVPPWGTVDVPVRIEATACQPPHDLRALYAGLRSLRARASGSGGSA